MGGQRQYDDDDDPPPPYDRVFPVREMMEQKRGSLTYVIHRDVARGVRERVHAFSIAPNWYFAKQ